VTERTARDAGQAPEGLLLRVFCSSVPKAAAEPATEHCTAPCRPRESSAPVLGALTTDELLLVDSAQRERDGLPTRDPASRASP
jgi:hypothetical protein